jgi:hypothetical protein
MRVDFGAWSTTSSLTRIVDQQHGGRLDGLEGLQGQQFRVTGPGADEGDFACVHAEANRKMCST